MGFRGFLKNLDMNALTKSVATGVKGLAGQTMTEQQIYNKAKGRYTAKLQTKVADTKKPVGAVGMMNTKHKATGGLMNTGKKG